MLSDEEMERIAEKIVEKLPYGKIARLIMTSDFDKPLPTFFDVIPQPVLEISEALKAAAGSTEA